MFVIAEHVVEHVVAASVSNTVPSPDVVRPAGHTVHALAPGALYEPATQVSIPIESSYVPVLHFGIDANPGQYEPAGHGCASLYNMLFVVVLQYVDVYLGVP